MPATKGNQNAVKPPSERTTGVGRCIFDAGEPRQSMALNAAQEKYGKKKGAFVDCLKEAIDEKLEREDYDKPSDGHSHD